MTGPRPRRTLPMQREPQRTPKRKYPEVESLLRGLENQHRTRMQLEIAKADWTCPWCGNVYYERVSKCETCGGTMGGW